MSDAVQIVALEDANAGLLDNLAPEVFDHPILPDQLRAFLDDERHFMFLAIDGGLVVGMASAVEYFHPDKRPHVWLNEVGVTPSYRRRGIGRRLVQAVIDLGRARGWTYAWLGTAADNASGQACFGSVPGGEEREAFYLYEWELEDQA